MNSLSLSGAILFFRTALFSSHHQPVQRRQQSGQQEQIEEELGDLLFSCVNTARHLHIDAETALRAAAEKFRRRFAQTEQLVTADGKEMSALPIEELDRYWDIAKQK